LHQSACSSPLFTSYFLITAAAIPFYGSALGLGMTCGPLTGVAVVLVRRNALALRHTEDGVTAFAN